MDILLIKTGLDYICQSLSMKSSLLDKSHANPYNNVVHNSGYSADGSALGSGPRGRGFDSRYSDQKRKVVF